jgi:copper chaperone CopZ
MTALKSLDQQGFNTSKVDFGFGGRTCASCFRSVEKAIAAVPGVQAANVNLATGRATVSYSDPSALGAVIEAVSRAGYEPRIA